MRTSKRLAKLEWRVYPEHLCLGAEDFEEDLSDGGICYIATRKGRDAGYAVLIPEEDGWYVSDLAILPEYRNTAVLIELLRWILGNVEGIVYCHCRTTIAQLVVRLCDKHCVPYNKQVEENYWDNGEVAYAFNILLSQ